MKLLRSLKPNLNLVYNRLFCCNHTCYCVGMVYVKSAAHYVTSASRYQSRSLMYIRGLIPRNSTKLAEAVPIVHLQAGVHFKDAEEHVSRDM